ncbi:hypothetical protein F2P56_021055 [Juglans regia]|uniref:Secreted RxLR effector protein 161-like n=1 Tax=Juglans regia TaxID=51240 RepID=A0A833X5Y3_JUGRE|nr:hypothetical protein F2P56_021055 [Juglans regia]
MSEAKPVSSPMSTSTSLSKFDNTAFDDPHLYRSTVGALQYLSLMRPDISFAVNKVCQYMPHPSISHWATVKQILRYLQNTIDHGLLLHHGSTFQLSLSIPMPTGLVVSMIANPQVPTVFSSAQILSLGAPRNNLQLLDAILSRSENRLIRYGFWAKPTPTNERKRGGATD